MPVRCHGETKLNIQMLEKEVNEKQVKNDTPVSPSSIDTGGILAMPPLFPYPSSFSHHRWRGRRKGCRSREGGGGEIPPPSSSASWVLATWSVECRLSMAVGGGRRFALVPRLIRGDVVKASCWRAVEEEHSRPDSLPKT
jgi:hypothetical protein